MNIIDNVLHLQNKSSTSSVIIPIAVMLLAGFALTRITKKLRLPNVTAYILAGMIIGPCGFHIVGYPIINKMDFIADIALAFIAFSTGEFFTFSELKKNGCKVLIITIFEASMASVLVFILSYYLLHMDLNLALILSALASTTAPASTVMTIRQLDAKGDFVNTLLQVVALDDVFGLVAYSVAISVTMARKIDHLHMGSMVFPIIYNILALLLGMAFGVLMRALMPTNRSTDNRLIIMIALLFGFCGICALFDISPLLGCMSMGAVYMNVTGDDKLFKQLNYFSPPILLLFFVRSGMNFRINALFFSGEEGAPLIIVGVLYFFVRILGKYIGAYLGAACSGKSTKIRNYLGLALIPQAGVAIGLSALGARILGGETGSALETVILASSVLYELIGPGCAKLALYLSGSYTLKLEDLTSDIKEKREEHNEVELLIARIQAIQKTLPNRRDLISEEEKAFTEAAEEQCRTR